MKHGKRLMKLSASCIISVLVFSLITAGMPGVVHASRGTGEHFLPNGASYYDNGTMMVPMNGKAHKFNFHADDMPQKSRADRVYGCQENTRNTDDEAAIYRVKCGLVAHDPLNNQTRTQQELQSSQSFWSYNGTAPFQNAPYAFNEDSEGLHIGVQAPSNGTYAGFFAVSPVSNATLFHAVLTAPVRAIPGNGSFFQNGMYVQTAQPNINYVTCVSITNDAGTVWAVVQASGTATEATQFNPLWVDTSPDQPLTRDCTIITNGSNHLKVYLDGAPVYESSSLSLNMPMPFNLYLEPQTSYTGQLLYGTYLDFYGTASENVALTQAPEGASTAQIVDTAGKVLASSDIMSGSAALDVGMYHEPISGKIIIKGSDGDTVASARAFGIFGGDRYVANSTEAENGGGDNDNQGDNNQGTDNQNSTISLLGPPTNLAATAASGSEIDLSWDAPSDLGSLLLTGYKIERSGDGGSTWSTIVSDTGSTATTYSDTGLAAGTTYSYRVSAISAVLVSSPSNTASATTSGSSVTAPQPPTGLSATAVSSSEIDLGWNAPSDNGGSAITGYEIERSSDGGSTWSVLVQNTASTSTGYHDTGLSAGTTYSYRVSAINSAGTSAPSNEASAMPQASASSVITVYAHRIPASYWDPCFATTCSAGTGPGASMWIALYDSAGKFIEGGFADENGHSFANLNSSATYYVDPTDCNSCGGAPHDVVFQYWGDNHSTVKPRAAFVGASLDAWYSCTNNCSGGP